jgi:SAM-dependent methyltransferase
VSVATHWWGTDVTPLGAPFDVIVATDCIYENNALEALVASLHALLAPDGVIYLGLETRLMMYAISEIHCHHASLSIMPCQALLMLCHKLIVMRASFGINCGHISRPNKWILVN